MKKYEVLLLHVGRPEYTAIRDFFVRHGYTQADTVSEVGEYHFVGDRLTVWPALARGVYTIDFFGNDIESISFNEEPLKECVVADNRLASEEGWIQKDSYVVHPAHGIARYVGRIERRYGEGWAGFIKLAFANDDFLFVPLDKAGQLMPYYGAAHPRLSRLHTDTWSRTKRRIAEDLLAVARDLLTIQAQREVAHRPRWGKAADWLQTLDDTFPHTLTEDQLAAVSDIMHDLTEEATPMDRLLTGDVGYGKTEVAIRAAAPVLASGRQVVVVAPTTILAEQHYDVWRERFKNLPIKVAKISRLTEITAAEKERINAGYYDLIIGTHRLFSKSWQFSRLGMVIVDEEQRFGVKQKEHFKQLRTAIDVLSLTATPIPRTLYMSLAGLRAMSTIRTAPGERVGVETTVHNYDPTKIAEAIIREKERCGQSYYIHNRIRTLEGVVSRLRAALHGRYKLTNDLSADPKTHIRYALAHGQMEAHEIAPLMHAFFAGQIDVLITTAIVEHGLDNPEANTMIIERAEFFGLADLYQLRGRVGRRDKIAYTLLFIGNSTKPRPVPLPLVAQKRLETMAETDKLGSGWSVALRDLEIRGAGSLIGARQHGNLEAIGLVLYSRMLKRLVERLTTLSSSDNLLSDTLAVWEA